MAAESRKTRQLREDVTSLGAALFDANERADNAERERDALLQALHGELQGRHELSWWAYADEHVVRCRYCQAEGRVVHSVIHALECPADEAQTLLDAHYAALAISGKAEV